MSRTASATAPPTVAPVTENARPMLHRSFRIGGPTCTVPLGKPTTTVRPDLKSSESSANVAVEAAATALSHPSEDPVGPAKQATPWMVAGADTVTTTLSMGTNHWSPMTFQ